MDSDRPTPPTDPYESTVTEGLEQTRHLIEQAKVQRSPTAPGLDLVVYAVYRLEMLCIKMKDWTKALKRRTQEADEIAQNNLEQKDALEVATKQCQQQSTENSIREQALAEAETKARPLDQRLKELQLQECKVQNQQEFLNNSFLQNGENLVEVCARQSERITTLQNTAAENIRLIQENARQSEQIASLQNMAQENVRLTRENAQQSERITSLENTAAENTRLTRENARQSEQIASLQSQLVLPNGDSIATQNARLTFENQALRDELVTERVKAARVPGLERTVSNLTNEMRRRDELKSTPTTDPRPQNKSRPLPSPIPGPSQKRMKSPVTTRRTQNTVSSTQPELIQPSSTTPAAVESQNYGELEIVAVKKGGWRPPKATDMTAVVKTYEELLEQLECFDGNHRIQATELEDAVKELLEPMLSRFRTEDGFASLMQTVKVASKCAVARLYKGNETCELASCDYCRFYKSLCVEVNQENRRCIMPRPENARHGLTMADAEFWIPPPS